MNSKILTFIFGGRSGMFYDRDRAPSCRRGTVLTEAEIVCKSTKLRVPRSAGPAVRRKEKRFDRVGG